MVRRVFYSFHYAPDCHRAAQIRQIGAIEGNRPATDNSWESIKRGGDPVIKRWIQEQMIGKSCTVVLVGAETAGRRWITYEIVESWNAGKGVVGIRIHGIKNLVGQTAQPGGNPFDHVSLNATGQRLSEIVKCYDPSGGTSKEKYGWICNNLSAAVEEAIWIRSYHK